MGQGRPGRAAAGRDDGVPVDDGVLDLLQGDDEVPVTAVTPAITASATSGGLSSGEGGTPPSYGRSSGPLPGQGPAAEHTDPQGTLNADAGARGTVSEDAAPAARCT